MKQKIEEKKLQIPNGDMRMLDLAIYNCSPRVISLLGSIPIMFTKELKRADRKIVERYNRKLRTWEVVPGKPKFPETGIKGFKRLPNKNG